MVHFATDCDRSIPPACVLPDGGVWVFGYGSMLWKVTFPYEECVVGYVTGFGRRFCQGSADHRGTLESPGRVVTLVDAPEVTTWGKAYRIHPERVEEVMEGLGVREQGGYHTTAAPITLRDGTTRPCIVYTSTPASPNYIDGEAMDATAKVIAFAVGPSGPNTEYLFNLNKALGEMGVPDDYCTELEALTRKHIANAGAEQ